MKHLSYTGTATQEGNHTARIRYSVLRLRHAIQQTKIMQYKDLRDFITALEKRGELKRITTPVDPRLEMTEIADRTLRAGELYPLYFSKKQPGEL